MCGRFTVSISPVTLLKILGIPTADEYEPRFNVAPGQNILTVVNEDGCKPLVARWGLVPHWSKDASIGYKMINARSETLQEKPSFRELFKTGRCLIPADGFYEWKQEGRSKTPYRFVLKDRSLFAFAGLWTTWRNPASGKHISSCTIITTEPNKLLAEVHDRMPVILPQNHLLQWLDHSDPSGLSYKELLRGS